MLRATRCRFPVWCTLLVLCLGSWGARAQEAPVAIGSRVRLTMGPGRVTGEVVAMDERQITLHSAGRDLVLIRPDVRLLEVSRKRSRKLKGALIGAGVGATAGLVTVASDPCTPEQEFATQFVYGASCSATAVAFVGAATVTGALLGVLIAPGERWTQVGDEHASLTVAPVRGGARLSLRLAF